MTKFVYNNAKNASTSHISFKFNYNYYLHISYEENIDPCSKSKLADELLSEFQKFMSIYCKNLYYA